MQALLALINDILDFSKIESGKMEIIPVEYELFSVIKESFDEADSGIEAAMIMFAIFFLPSILVSCLVMHLIYKAFSK